MGIGYGDVGYGGLVMGTLCPAAGIRLGVPGCLFTVQRKNPSFLMLCQSLNTYRRGKNSSSAARFRQTVCPGDIGAICKA